MSETKEATCACVHFDRYVCANVRHQRQAIREEFDPCDCSCHDDQGDDDELEADTADFVIKGELTFGRWFPFA